MSSETADIDETVVVVLGAERLHPQSIADIPSDAYVIAADSGVDHARSAGLLPREVVGDFDSISRRGLKWARQHGCPWNENTCSDAARGGHLGVLQWARQNGCPWSEETASAAAYAGHLAVLQWAIRNGCPWSKAEHDVF